MKLLGHDRAFCDFEDEGFLTSTNRMVSRAEAVSIADSAKQLICSRVPSELRSKDLY
jgi:hypothetical protein